MALEIKGATHKRIVRQTIPLVLVSKAVAFLAFGLFHGWWRYVSIRDILPIVGGCTLGSLLFWGVDLFLMADFAVPHSIYAIDWVLTLMFVLGALVKGYHPMYEFHGGPGAPVGAAAPNNPKTAEQGRSCHAVYW